MSNHQINYQSNPMASTGASKSSKPPRSPRHSIIMQGFDKLPIISKDHVSSTAKGSLTPQIGGEDVNFYNDAYFQLVRKRFCIPTDVVDAKEICNWDKMKPSEGKGGDAMLFTPDRKYIIKELGSDHSTLLNITKEYVEHVCGDSLLVRFAFHFYRCSNKKNYVVMNSWLPGPDEEHLDKKGFQEDQYQSVFDLKGCADDKMMVRGGKTLEQVHKRCWHCKLKCSKGNQARKNYKNAKVYARKCDFMLHFDERKRLMSKIQSDAQFLRKQGLMDYSLIVGVKQCPINVFKEKYLKKNKDGKIMNGGFSGGDIHGRDQKQPYYSVHDGQVYAYYIGIIDFLQFYNTGKKVAHYIKCCDIKPLATVRPTVYGTRFEDYFSQKFKVTKENTPEWLKVGGISDLNNDGDDHGNMEATQMEMIPLSNVKRVETTFKESKMNDAASTASPVKQIATGAAMVITAAGIAAIEMGFLGAPPTIEIER